MPSTRRPQTFGANLRTRREQRGAVWLETLVLLALVLAGGAALRGFGGTLAQSFVCAGERIRSSFEGGGPVQSPCGDGRAVTNTGPGASAAKPWPPPMPDAQSMSVTSSAPAGAAPPFMLARDTAVNSARRTPPLETSIPKPAPLPPEKPPSLISGVGRLLRARALLLIGLISAIHEASTPIPQYGPDPNQPPMWCLPRWPSCDPKKATRPQSNPGAQPEPQPAPSLDPNQWLSPEASPTIVPDQKPTAPNAPNTNVDVDIVHNEEEFWFVHNLRLAGASREVIFNALQEFRRRRAAGTPAPGTGAPVLMPPTRGTDDAPAPDSPIATPAGGQWAPATESMSARALAYQARITGRGGQVFIRDGVKFDGMANGVLLEAKGPGYATFVRNGSFQPWFTGADGLVEQAQRQLAAADGNPIRWHFAEEAAADATRALFRQRGISGIEVRFTP